jgi:copper(I)-binding protein
MTRTPKITAWIVVLLAGVLAACTPPTSGPKIRVENAWGRPSPQGTAVGAFYLEISNDSRQADVLIAGESQECGATEIHETYQVEEGVMSMRPVEQGVQVRPGEVVEFMPGGLHIMCINPSTKFTQGAALPLTLIFEISGPMDIQVEITE